MKITNNNDYHLTHCFHCSRPFLSGLWAGKNLGLCYTCFTLWGLLERVRNNENKRNKKP